MTNLRKFYSPKERALQIIYINRTQSIKECVIRDIVDNLTKTNLTPTCRFEESANSFQVKEWADVEGILEHVHIGNESNIMF